MMKEEQTSEPVSEKTCSDDEIEPLTGKPFFDIVLCKSHVFPSYHLAVPSESTRLLPAKSVPLTFTRGKRSWKSTYMGNGATLKRIDSSLWKAFVIDNRLKVGDACVFEIMEHSDTSLKFKVQVLRGDFPSVLLDREHGSSNNPVIIE